MLAGLLLAFGAAATTGVASVLQAVAARQAGRGRAGRAGRAGCAADAGQIGRLVVSPLYIGGTALDGLGFLCIVAALRWLPLFLVQCAAASSIGVTALVGRRVLATRMPRRDLVALLALGTGLVLLAAGAKPEAATAVDRSAQWLLVIAAAPVIAGGAALARVKGARAGGALAAAAGLAFAGTGVASRILSNAHSVGDVLDAPATYALAAFGVGGMVFFAASLQRVPVTIATAALFGVETIAASAVGLLILGDSTRHGFKALTAIGFVITLGCALALALSEADAERSGLVAGPATGLAGVDG